MKIYDKAAWHIDGGENKDTVIKKMGLVLTYLAKHNMLTDEGKEIVGIGIDSSISLHERMVNEKGQKFLNSEYDSLLELSESEMQEKLSKLS